MEIAIPAPVAGRVRDVFVARNVQVDAGTPLFRIEPVGDADDADAGRRPHRPRRTAGGAGAGRRRALDARRGRSCSASTSSRPRPAALLGRRSTPIGTPAVLAILDAFADLVARSPPSAATRTPTTTRGAARAPQHLPALARRRARGPAGVVRRPAAAGPRPLRRGRPRARAPALEEALLRHLRRPAAPRRAARRRDRAARRLAAAVRRPRRLRETLDRLIERDPAALPGGRQPGPQPCATAASTGRTSTGPAPRSSAHDAPARHRARRPAPSTSRPRRRARRLPAARCVPILAEDDLLGRHADAGPAARGADPALLQDPRARRPVDASAPTASCRAEYVHDDRTRARRRRPGSTTATSPRRSARAAEAAADGRRARTPRSSTSTSRRRPTAPADADALAGRAGRTLLAAVGAARRRSGASRSSHPTRTRRPTCSRSGGPAPTGVRPVLDGRRSRDSGDASPRTSSSAACTR